MDIDDNLHGTNTANGFSHHGTVSHSQNAAHSSTTISNGHSLLDDERTTPVIDHTSTRNGNSTKSTDLLDTMDYDGHTDATHTMDMESTDEQKCSTSKEDYQLLLRILHFGRELHALKQQLTAEHGDNPQNDKMLQVSSPSFTFIYPRASLSEGFPHHIHPLTIVFSLLGCIQSASLSRSQIVATRPSARIVST